MEEVDFIFAFHLWEGSGITTYFSFIFLNLFHNIFVEEAQNFAVHTKRIINRRVIFSKKKLKI